MLATTREVRRKAIVMMDGWNMTGWSWGWMSIGTLLAIILIGVVVAALMRPTMPPNALAEDSALAVLRRRYAAGEIDDTEFQKRRAALGG